MDDANADLASSARKYWSDEGWTPGGVIREVDTCRVSTASIRR